MSIQKLFQKQIDYLYSFAPTKDFKFPGEHGLKRTKFLLHKLKDPQEKIKVIHVAGTSGKGSTCYILSSILIGQGYKVGLSLSPHLLDIRERTQINNQFLSKELYCKYFDEIKPAIKFVSEKLNSSPTHFEILTALNYYIFNKEKVDYAIMETGLGGTYDATNVVINQNKLSIITKIGFDHISILGNTLSKIAAQKGGIINPFSTLITTKQSKKVTETLRNICLIKNTKIIQLDKNNFKQLKESTFSYKYKSLYLPEVHISLLGDYQIENTTLAITSLLFIGERDKFIINIDLLLKSLNHLKFLGRFSIYLIRSRIVIFDGAHNTQKMNSFITSLMHKYPNKLFNFLIAFKHKKDYNKMLNTIIPVANHITLTSFGLKLFNVGLLSNSLNKNHFINFDVYNDPNEALTKLLKDSSKLPIIVTGSLYLLPKFSRYLK